MLTKSGELHQITTLDDKFKITDLAISHDGKLVAFTLNTQLFVINSSGETQFSSHKEQIHKNPIFSNDGSSIYYSINDKDGWFIESQSISQLSKKERLTKGYINYI